MNTDLSDLRQDFSDLKQNYIKLESELSIDRQFNNKLKEHIVSLERQYWSNSLYSKRECLGITGILDKTDQKDLENTALNIFRKLDVENHSSDNEDCHWLPNNKANEVNRRLVLMCKERNISFLSHDESIDPSKHLNESKLHLNSSGIKIFAENFSRFLVKLN